MYARAVGKLADAMDAAVETLVRNLTAEPPSVQVRAAVALLELAMKLRSSVELERRVAELEAAVAGEGAGVDDEKGGRRDAA